jgi:hypothetical protein
MKKFIIAIPIILSLTGCTQKIAQETQASLETTQVCFPSTCVEAEIAETLEEKKTGLMFRESLQEFSGMLFPYDQKNIYTFWMKNTLIPLDIIWIADTKIVHIEKATPCTTDPCETYKSETPANHILEVNSGFTEKNNIKIGDTVEIKEKLAP